jgi:hypothetical protein
MGDEARSAFVDGLVVVRNDKMSRRAICLSLDGTSGDVLGDLQSLRLREFADRRTPGHPHGDVPQWRTGAMRGTIDWQMATAKPAPSGAMYGSAAAYGAAGWAFLFALMSFYWAFGGRASISTQAVAIQNQIDDPGFVALLWVTGALKLVAGLIALALVLPLGRRIPRRPLLIVGWVTAVILLLYGSLGWLQALLWETGVQTVPAAVGPRAARWKLIFWDPFWTLGGSLFLISVRQFQGRPKLASA